MKKSLALLVSLTTVFTLTQAQAIELNSLALRSPLDVEADLNLERNSALLLSVGGSGIGGGYKYFLDRNHAGFNIAARGAVGLNTQGASFSGTLGYRFLIPTANSGLRAIELEVEGGPTLNTNRGGSDVSGVLFLRAGIRL